MKKLGVETIFDEDKANLTNISDDPLYVSKAINTILIGKFNNILRAAFASIFFCKKIVKIILNREKLCNTLSYKKQLINCW